MKFGRVWKALAVLVLLALATVWWLPAAWVRSTIEARLPGVRLEHLSGSIWHGRAEQLIGPDGKDLGTLAWELSRRAVWGDVRLVIDMQGPDLTLHARMRKVAPDRHVWDQVAVRGDAARIVRRFGLPDGYMQGRIEGDVRHAELQGNWPVALDGQARWSDGVLGTRAGPVRLGTLMAKATGENGVVTVKLSDDGRGPLSIDGTWLLSTIGWRFDATAAARSTDPALHRWLESLGPVGRDGKVHIQRSGGAAALVRKGQP